MNLIKITDLNLDQVFEIFDRADYFLKNKPIFKYKNKCVGLLFFDESIRTRVGFEVSSWKLGLRPIFISKTKPSKSRPSNFQVDSWSESIEDTIRTLDAYFDAFFIRHSDENIFKKVLPYTKKPIINCGNGDDEHPTQALIDAYSIRHRFGRLDNLTITLIGNIKYSRSVHSLLKLLDFFPNTTLQQIAPDKLVIKNSRDIPAIRKQDLGKEDILYSAGFAPTTPSGTFSQQTVKKYAITLEDVSRLSKACIIMNPLPRIDEIDFDVDGTKNAYYFRQNELSLYVRMAIIDLLCDLK